MTGFVQQILAVPDGSVKVSAQTTACPHLVIAPSITIVNGLAEFTGDLGLVHTITGLAVGRTEWPRPLGDLAERLAALDWNFDDRDHFKKPENSDMLEAVRRIYRDWETSHAFDGPVHYSGESDEVKAAREADPAGTMLGEHIEWWMRHSKALRDKDSGMPTFEDNPKAYAAEISLSVEGYGLIYLLAVLRATDPKIADIAARDLIANFEAGDALGEWVWQWHEDLVAGKPLTLRGIPTGDPLEAFGIER